MVKSKKRYPLFDTLRGFAMIIMAIYHFCFDLNQFSVLHQNFNTSEFWLDFRALIMSLFTGLVGVGFYLGNASFKSKTYRQRLWKILGCALLITVVTYFMFPETWVFFGILHYVFFVSLLGPLLVLVPWLCFLLGIALVVTPMVYRGFIFGKPVLILSGLAPFKPMTEDFAPLMPWLGVTMLGIFVGYIVKKKSSKVYDLQVTKLSRLGHHSLIFYMTHQLVLFPLAWLISQLI